MSLLKSQDVSQRTMEEKLRILGQPKSVYNEWVASSPEDRLWIESVVDTVLIKGYMPA